MTGRDTNGGVVLAARNVRRDYQMAGETVHAVRGVSLEVTSGDWVALVGPSGCGKSTLLNLLGAIDRPTSGAIIVLRQSPPGTGTQTSKTFVKPAGPHQLIRWAGSINAR